MLEGSNAGRLEGWTAGGLEWSKAGRLEGWKTRMFEGWKAGRLDGSNARRLEGCKAGRLEASKARRLEGCNVGRLEGWHAPIADIHHRFGALTRVDRRYSSPFRRADARRSQRFTTVSARWRAPIAFWVWFS